MGKPHSGVTNSGFLWLGSYDECVATEAKVNISVSGTAAYKGRYCTAKFKAAFIQVKIYFFLFMLQVDDDDQFLRPFQHYLNHIEMMKCNHESAVQSSSV